MNGVNRVTLYGFLGMDPEAHTSKTGKPYVRLSVATHYNKKQKNADGERQSMTTWHHVTVWGKSADRCRSRLTRGSAVYVEGYLSRYSYERPDGTDASAVSIVARDVQFDSRKLASITDAPAFGQPFDSVEDSSNRGGEARSRAPLAAESAAPF